MVLVLDALSLLYRTSPGDPDGFVTLVQQVLDDESPVGLAIAIDAPGPTVRTDGYPAYKAGRSPAPNWIQSRIPRMAGWAAALGAPLHRVDRQEADDVIATLATRIPGPTRIVTADSDLLQLIGGRVSVRWIDQKRQIHEVWDEAVFRARYGFAPSLLPTWKAMVGDRTDNLPGIPGIGPPTATRLCARHGDGAAILAAVDAGQVGNRRLPPLLDAGREELLRWEQLGRLDRTLPLTEPLWGPVRSPVR